MPNPNYVTTITVYRRTPASASADNIEHWERAVLRGCFWKCQTNTIYNGTQAQKANTYIVRIPVALVGRGYVCRAGDIVVKGECKESGSDAILKAYKPNAFKVSTFADNTMWMGAHYRLEG